MKKNLITIIAGICAMTLLVGCAGNTGTLSNRNIKIKQYKGLEVEKIETIAVTDEDVELSIQSELDTIATKTDITGRSAKLGDIAIIDFEGKKDGVAFEGGTGTDYELELGSGTFIDGFEDGVVGHKIGETFDLNLTFPATYGNTELAGQAVVFTVTLKGLQEKTVPEITADVLEQLGRDAKTVEEYKAQVKEELEKSNKESAEATFLSSIWEALVEQCEVKKFPKEAVDEYVTSLEEYYAYYAQMYNVELEEFFQQIFGMSVEQIAENMVTKDLAIELIAKKEKLTLTEKEYEEGVKKLAEQYGYDDTEEFLEASGEDAVREELLQEKVGNFLIKHCVQVEPKKAE